MRKNREAWTPEQIAYERQRNLNWRLANAEKIRQRKRELYLQNHEHELERARLKRLKNPEKQKIYDHNRRALKSKAVGTYTQKDICFLANSQKHLCVYCRSFIDKKSWHVDHIVPLSLGGSNEKTNLQLLCATCNLRKYKKHPVDFAQQMGFLL
jgi:5-methylcytosine-specific restriction endonuclease McrA